MIPHLNPLMLGKSRRRRIDLPAGRVPTSRHLEVSASLFRGACQTTHLADRQLHQTALSPSSIELRQFFNLGNISFRPFFNQGWSLQYPASTSSIITSDNLRISAEARAPTAMEHWRHHLFEFTQQIAISRSIFDTSPNKSRSPPLQTHLCGS